MHKLVYKQVLLFAYTRFALQELGKQNPDLLQMINSNQEEFLRMINDPAAPGEPDMAALAGAAGVSSLFLETLFGICFGNPICHALCICLSSAVPGTSQPQAAAGYTNTHNTAQCRCVFPFTCF